MTKNIQVSFRLTPRQLAHGLEIIQSLEPSYHPASLSAMVKLIYQDYLAKMSIVSNPVPGEAAIDEITQMMSRSKVNRAILGQQPSGDSQELERIMTAAKKGIPKGIPKHFFAGVTSGRVDCQHLGNKSNEPGTESQTNVVTDFSPPTMEELIKGGNEE